MKNKFKTIKLKENIRLSKARSEWRCAYCYDKIEVGELTFVIYGIATFFAGSNPEYRPQGNGVRIHTRCIDGFGNSLIQFKQENIKRIIVEAI